MFTLRKIVLVLMVDAVPLGRARFSRGHVYVPQRSRDYRKVLQTAARQAMSVLNAPPMEGELYARLSVYRKFNATSRNFGDLDNHAKAICDAFNGLIYRDDSQIIAVQLTKHTDKTSPRVVAEFGDVDFMDAELPTTGTESLQIVSGVLHVPRICPCEPRSAAVSVD